jgi:hypothetical protein
MAVTTCLRSALRMSTRALTRWLSANGGYKCHELGGPGKDPTNRWKSGPIFDNDFAKCWLLDFANLRSGRLNIANHTRTFFFISASCAPSKRWKAALEVDLYNELMSSDDDDEMEILELSEEEDNIQLIGSGERLSCCFCRGEQCFDTPVEALPKEGCLIEPFLSHSRSEVPASQLYAHINCARSAPGLDLGARDTLPAEVLRDLEAQGYDGKLRCTMMHPLAFAEHFADQLRAPTSKHHHVLPMQVWRLYHGLRVHRLQGQLPPGLRH